MRDPIINIAVSAARAAGNVIVRSLDKLKDIRVTEKHPNDYVTEVDQQAEKEIVNIIRKNHPNHSILGEECGEVPGANKDYVWIIDPLDGTRNYIHGFMHFCVSIGISYKGKVEHGVIYDPVRQELFTASRGKGARLNDRRIRVSEHSTLDACLLGTGFPYRYSENYLTAYLDSLRVLIPLSGDIRRAGSAALDLAYVAAGRLDAFWELGLKVWDIAAGTLLIKEAGGITCDINGGDDYMKTGNVITGNPKILKLLMKKIKPCFDSI